MSTRLTIQILTKNEEAALPRCLASLSGLEAEVLVIDSISTDRTREIALAAGARVLEHPFVDFASQLNWGLEQASGEWVLIIDADELLDSRLRESIRETVYHPSPLSEVYSLVRDSFFLGRRMRASAWSGERLPRLFKKGALSYSGLVHQVPDLGGRVPGLLKGRLHHHTYRSLEQFFSKMRHYAVLWAEDAHRRGKSAGLARVFLSAGWRFFHDYVIRLGFLDGGHGLLAAAVYSFYTFEKYARLWEKGK